MDGPDVADAGTMPRHYPQNPGEDADLLYILYPQGAEELRFLRIARHSPSVARYLSVNSKRCGLSGSDARCSENVTLSVKGDNLDIADRSELLSVDGRNQGGLMKLARVAALAPLAVLVTVMFAACGGDGDKDKSATATQSGSPSDGADDEVKLTLVAENTKFDKTSLEAPAGKDVTLTMENKDSIEHTFALYETKAATHRLAGGQTFSGPAFLTYQFTAPETPGTYHFQCDIHPNAMNGEFIVK